MNMELVSSCIPSSSRPRQTKTKMFKSETGETSLFREDTTAFKYRQGSVCWPRFIIKDFNQRSKKVVSDSLGLVDFAIGQVNFVLNLPDG